MGWKVSTDQLRHRWIAQKRSVSMLAAPKKCFQHMKKGNNHKRCNMFTLSLWIHLKESPNKDIAKLQSFKNSSLVQKCLGSCGEASCDDASSLTLASWRFFSARCSRSALELPSGCSLERPTADTLVGYHQKKWMLVLFN